jgi:predicted nucleotide-binding protein
MRARQNVIFELGYFVGKLGRKKVCALYHQAVEIPSDYHGVVYTPLDSTGAWRTELERELKAADIL